MPILEDLKEYAERATGIRRPGKRAALDLVRPRKPHTVRFKDDGLIPNHPRWPLILYRGAVDIEGRSDPAAVIEDLFEAKGWRTPGVMASTITYTTTPESMKYLASRAEEDASASAAPRVAYSR